MGSQAEPNDKRIIVLTGFGPFEGHPVNASWEVVRTLRDKKLWSHPKFELLIEEIPVTYDFVQQQLPDRWNKDRDSAGVAAVINVGVSGIAKRLTLETRAANGGYRRKDVKGNCPTDEKCVDCDIDENLATVFDVDDLVKRVNDCPVAVECESSTDAGRYLCEFVFYKSLSCYSRKALFVHVPNLGEDYTKEKMAEGLCQVLDGVAEQLLKLP